MLCRSLVVVTLTGACGFQHGAAGTGDASGGNGSDDAGVDGMRPIDAMPDAFGFCYGSFKNFCFTTMPSGDYTISALTNFDTDVDANCSTIVAQTNGPSLCVVAAANIQLGGDVRATGSRGLVFIATNTFSNGASLDVGSFYLAAASWTGAGIATGALCGAPTGGAADDNGAGGGAGGTFGAAGGNGARGRNSLGGTGGVAAAAPAAPTVLRGGCNGTAGGAGGGNAGGTGGAGGGVLYVIAETSIMNGGTIRSSGQGGPGGGILAGGGGGGAGGMIVLDSPTISNTGFVIANGGGGGEGGGQNGGGEAGDSGLVATTRAAGGATNVNGGDGGPGGATTTPTGGPGITGAAAGGGGGGGGGSVGVIKALRGTLAGIVSPPAI
jgi:hypothetical protein